jgi:hypothetical protein
MTDFGNLKSLEVKAEKTAPFTIYQIEGEPMLHLAPATEVNKPYFNALLKRSRKNQRRINSGSFTSAVIQENRDNDRELYPLYVVRGWERVVDSSGNAAEFTPENVRDFLTALPDYLFDEVRNFATEPSNFVSEMVNKEELSGNSPQG